MANSKQIAKERSSRVKSGLLLSLVTTWACFIVENSMLCLILTTWCMFVVAKL